jgi:ERF superfamily
MTDQPIPLPWVDRSPELDQLFAAFVKALGEVTEITKNHTAKVQMKTGGEYTYSYADLADTLEAIRPVLAANGLGLTQPVATRGDSVLVWTTILHVSGQYVTYSPLEMGAGRTPQETGSAITYGRRYAASAALNLASEDNDAAAAAAKPKRTSTARTGGEPPAQPPDLDADAKARLHSLKDSRYSSAQLLTTARKIAAAEGHAQPTTIEALAVDESLVEATLAALDGRPVEKPQALAATGTTDAERAAPAAGTVRHSDYYVMPNIVAALALLLAEMEPADKAKLATWGKTQGIGNILKPTPEQAQLLYDHAIGEEKPY